MKYLLAILIVLTSLSSLADSEIRSSSGASCESSDFQPWEVSAGFNDGTRAINNRYYDTGLGDYNNTSDENYASLQVTYKFGGSPSIDCNTFARKVEREQEAYTTKLELKVRQLESQLSKQQQVSAVKVRFK